MGSVPNAWFGGGAFGGNNVKNTVTVMLQKIRSKIYPIIPSIVQLIARRV